MEPIPSIGLTELLICGSSCLALVAVIVAVVAIVLVVYTRRR